MDGTAGFTVQAEYDVFELKRWPRNSGCSHLDLTVGLTGVAG
jgi:hypothetical protein